MLYSGDDFYGDEITSPRSRPIRPNLDAPLARADEQPRPAPRALSYDEWEARLGQIVLRRVGCDLDDLPDTDTYSGWEDGLTPSQYFTEILLPELDSF